MARRPISHVKQSTPLGILALSKRLIITIGIVTATTSPAIAQSILVDDSTNTRVDNDVSCSGTCSITGGLRGTGSLSNLFHSFINFNVDTNATVTFEDPGVANIFSRVTGKSGSNIDGTLKVDGSANLYLLNPNGIVFGENTKLEIPGSFLSSTAESLLFEDSKEFSTLNQSTQSLLSVSVPTGLQFGSSPAPISISGNGHALTYESRSSTISRNTPSTGLHSGDGRSLTFLGGEISLQGGNLISPSGFVQIGSIGGESKVDLTTHSRGWDIDYSDVSSFQNVFLSQQSSIDVSGSDAGSVQIDAQNISIREGSAVFAKIESSGDGSIDLNASNNISVVGESLSTSQPMLTGAFIEIATGATGSGESALTATASTIDITQSGQIGIGMAGTGSSGTVEITAPTINVDGADTVNLIPSAIYAAVLSAYRIGGSATGQGADLTINTEQLNVTNSAQITSSTFDGGNAGNLTVNASDIVVSGRDPLIPVAVSSIRSASEIPPLGFVLNSNTPPTPRFPSVAEGSGNAGTVTLNTKRLRVDEGAQIAVGTFGNNSGGNLIVNASESVELRGRDDNGRSGLFANALGDKRIPVNSTGEGGSITVSTQQLDILEGATINASTAPSELQTGGNGKQSEGTAGDIQITASRINIKNGSLITADTVTGDRANIAIQSDSLVLREAGQITTNATGTATGGNISINTEALIAFENSDITANAVDNFGGRIIVNAPTILGTAYREQLTPESDITATSELGPAFSGSVELNSPEIDPTDGTVELPEGLNAEDQIVAACENLDTNTFISTGRGGLPEGSNQLIPGQSLWHDFRSLEERGINAIGNHDSEGAISGERFIFENVESGKEVVEAQDWTINSDGKVVLGTSESFMAVNHHITQCLSS